MPFGENPARHLFVLVALAVAACLVPLLVGLSARGPASWHEGLVLASSQETWLRQRSGETGAWLVPTVGGKPRYAKPPLMVWLTMASWSGLDPDEASTGTLILRSRLVGTLLGLVTLASVFWIGATLGDRWLGALAALVGASLLSFQEHARMASYDTGLLAFSALAVAGAVWAVSPRGGRQRRRWLGGWALCGAGLAAAWMSKGPLAVAVVLCGALPAVILRRAGRRSNLLALAAAIALAALAVLPWYLHLAGAVPSLASRLGHEYAGPAWDARPPWYYATHPQWTLPWILWVLCGLVHPLLRRRSRRVLVAWAWFVALFVFFSLAPPKMPRYLLPIVPALALLVAVVLSDDERRARGGERDPAARWVIVPHWLGLLLFSLLFVTFLAAQDWLVTRGWMDERRYGLLPWPAAALGGAVLGGLALAGLRWHLRGRVLAAGLLCALWASLATALNWDARSRGADPFQRVEAETRRVLAAVGDGRLCVLDEGADAALDGAFVFATRRLVPAVGSPVPESGLFVIATAGEGSDSRLAEAGFTPVLDFLDAPHRARRLWR